MNNRLLIAGACARPLIESAMRGLGSENTFFDDIIAIDLFADWDSCQSCPTIKVSRLDEISSIAEKIDFDAVVIGGGLENQPSVLRQLAKKGPLLAPDVATIACATNPIELFEFLKRNQFDAPETSRTLPASEAHENWIAKPFDSAGGFRIVSAQSTTAPSWTESTSDFYFQRLVSGLSFSALFATDVTTTTHLGLTHQLVGTKRLTRQPFAYCGSIGPIRLPTSIESTVNRFGQLAASEFGLRGVWGADFIVSHDRVFVIEINPRMTAACEMFERFHDGPSIMSIHIDCFRNKKSSNPIHLSTTEFNPKCNAKAIAFSSLDHSVVVDGPIHKRIRAMRGTDSPPKVSDIPNIGATIPAFGPIATVFEMSETRSGQFCVAGAQKMLTRLCDRVSDIRNCLIE